MVVYDLRTMQACEIKEKTVLCLGTFDGCHIGHRSVFGSAYRLAKQKKAKSVIYTFDSIPKTSPNGKRALSIMTKEEKIKAFQKSGIDYLALDSFERVKNMSGEGFVNEVLIKELSAVGATCGYNFCFGKNREANAENLKEFFEKAGGSVEICPKVMLGEQTLSSTLIREMLSCGRVEELLECMGPYSVYAEVLRGKGLGSRELLPTINQKIPEEKVKLKNGVYITECEIGEDVYPSITNVGVRPTTDKNGEVNMETYILDYSKILYNSHVKVNFYKYLREERVFSSLAELKEQIASDARQSREYFK